MTNDAAASGEGRAASGPPIGSVDRALEVLLLFRTSRTVYVSDVCERLDVTFSTGYRLLTALAFRGFAEQVPGDRGYRAGPMLLEVGAAALRDLDILARVQPAMERAVEELGETVLVGVLAADEVVVLSAVEPKRALRVDGRSVARLSAHGSAAGRVLLAEAGSSASAEAEAELGRVREAGYAFVTGDVDGDVNSVAVPIRDDCGVARGALFVSGPRTRFDGRRLEDAAQVLTDVLAGIPAGTDADQAETG